MTCRGSPRSAAFPPQPPPKVALLCSAGSQVLRHSPTPPPRACPHYGIAPSRTGLPTAQARRRSPGSRACCFSACARVSDYAGFRRHLRWRTVGCGLPLTSTGSASRRGLFAARYPAHRCLCLCFGCHLAMTAARLEVKMDRYSFLVGLFHPRQHAGLSRRSDVPRFPQFRGLDYLHFARHRGARFSAQGDFSPL